MPNFSHSKIKTFESCPLKYKFNYIDKIKVEIENTVEAFMGSVVHKALEKLYRDLMFDKTDELKDIIEFYKKEWKNDWSDAIKITKPDYQEKDYMLMGEKYIKDYYNHYFPFNNNKLIGLETEEFLDLNDQYKFHIRIDRLNHDENGTYEIHDYKTSGFLQKLEYFEQDWQLAMYALWVKTHFKDAKRVKLIWHYLAFDREIMSERTIEQLEKLKAEVLEKIKLIEMENEFLPKVSKLCDYCIYQEVCPMW